MKTIINEITDPYYNLALEEYLLKYFRLKKTNFSISGRINHQSSSVEIKMYLKK